MTLDPDDPRPPYLQVAAALREAIKKGDLRPGQQLPSGSQLAARYNVARMTVQSAIRVLRHEGLVVSRQGSGVFVRARVEARNALAGLIEQAFAARTELAVDFAGLTGEALLDTLREPLERALTGNSPVPSISVRALLPDLSSPMPLPCRANDLGDDAQFRERLAQTSSRSLTALTALLDQLVAADRVQSADLTVRLHSWPALFKLFLINRTDAFLGMYPIRERSVSIRGSKHTVFDLIDKDATMTHEAAAEAAGVQFVRGAIAWFETVWSSLSHDSTP